MGRHENDVAAGERYLRQLALWLRQQRQLPYSQLAERTHFHRTTLQRAANGKDLPSLDVVLAYAEACQADTNRARTLWRRAVYWHHVPSRHDTVKAPPAKILPEFVETFGALHKAMLEMRRQAGWPSLRRIQERAQENGDKLPASTLSLILRTRAALHKPQFVAYMQACDVKPADQLRWEAAWDRANASRIAPTAPPASLLPPNKVEVIQALNQSDVSPQILVRILAKLHAHE